jgi:hypothetical protein
MLLSVFETADAAEFPMMFIGHSHITCIVEAARIADVPAPEINLWLWPNVVITRDGRRQLGDELKAAMPDLVISSVGGGTHHVMGLHPHPQVFDFVVPDHPDLPVIERATMIPYDQIRQTMLTAGESDFEVLRLMGESVRGRMIHVPPPPTRRDEKPIDHPLWRKLVGDSDRISPLWLRRKLELVHTSLLREMCAAANILLLTPPPAAVDEEGFLRPEFAGAPCHGNARYGALVLDQVRALAS